MSISIHVKHLSIFNDRPFADAPPPPPPDDHFRNATKMVPVQPDIDIRQPPRMVKLGADGDPLPNDATSHSMVLLPDFGLIFDARAPAMAENWADAKRRAEACDLPGDGWRLPERQELQLLIDPSRHNPAINAEFFPHTPTNDWYWTATALASSPAVYAWIVLFYYGLVSSYNQGYSGFVRACRRVPPGQ